MPRQRKLVTALVILVSLGLLVPGVTQPILTLTGNIEKSDISQLGIGMLVGEEGDPQMRQLLTTLSSLMGLDQIEGQLQAYSNTRSIWGTVTTLANTGNLLVAFLVVFFSLVIPVFKLLLQFAVVLISRAELRRSLLWLNARMSKWSMADVFVMGLLVAYLAGSASDQMGNLLIMEANLEIGFYYFLAYCLFSIAASSLVREHIEVSKPQA